MHWTPSEADTQGAAFFFDGETGARQEVRLAAGHMLVLLGADGAVLQRWPWAEVITTENGGPGAHIRLTRSGGPPLARLDVRDAQLANAIRQLKGSVPRHGLRAGSVAKVFGLTLAAILSLAAVGAIGVPAVADRVATVLPWSVDVHLGKGLDSTLRSVFGGDAALGDCGTRNGEEAGRRALDKLIARMAEGRDLPFDLHVAVLRNDSVNALAAPGGYLYVLGGLVTEAETPEEVAGVLAHEIGHAVARDGTRKLIQSAGATFVLGLMLGDFAGGGAAIIAIRALSENAYSRDAEHRADEFALELMARNGIDPSGLEAFFRRLSVDDGGPSLFSSHPVTAERLKRVTQAGKTAATRPLLDSNEWQALKNICEGRG